jgi:hypothetical protein
MYDLADFAAAMRLLEDGLLSTLPIEDLVARYSLEDAGGAFRDAASGDLAALKAVLVP